MGSFEPGEIGARDAWSSTISPRFSSDSIPSYMIRPSPSYFMPCLVSIFNSIIARFFCVPSEGLTGTSQPRLALVHRNGTETARALRGRWRRFGIMVDRHEVMNIRKGRLDVVALVAQLEQQGIDAVLLFRRREDLVSMA